MIEELFQKLPIKTLRGKFLVINIPILLITLGALLIGEVLLEYNATIEEINNRINDVISREKINIAKAIYDKNKGDYVVIINRIASDPNIKFIKLLNHKYNVLSKNGTENKKDFTTRISDITTIVNGYKTNIGYLVIQTSTKQQKNIMMEKLFFDIGFLMVALLILTFGALFTNRNIIDKPLSLLISAIAWKQEKNKYQKVFWNSKDEIGTLVAEFNAMQEQISHDTQKLQDAKDKAIKADEFKTDFLANMSHELRTPMHSIIGFSKLLEKKYEQLEPEKAKGYISTIKESSERLLALVNDLLDLSKLEAQKMILKKQALNIVSSIKSVVLELEPIAKDKKVNIIMHNSEENIMGFYDDTRICQVIRNLLSNAIKFTPEEKNIEVSVYTEIQNLIITVKDEGVGIPQDELETVFDKFVQSTKTCSGAGGTGLGLSICKEIVRLHYGKIYAQNNKPTGAVFVLELPRYSRASIL